MKRANLLLICFLFCFFSCSDETDRSKGLVNVFLIGSGGEFSQIWLEVLGVEIRTVGSRGAENPESVFLPNTQVDKRVNIASLTANSQFLVGRGEFSENPITEIILRLGDDNFVFIGNERFPLQLSGEGAANPRLSVNFSVSRGISHDLFLDFDPIRSFVISPGLEPRIELIPFIRPFMSLDRGRANGTISPANQRVTILTFDESGEWITTTETQPPSGNFSIRGLEEKRMYKIFIFPFNESYLPDTLDSVRVNVREITTLGTINLRLIED